MLRSSTKFSQLIFLWKFIETSLENLYVDIGAYGDHFFRSLGPHFGLKIRGRGGPLH